MQDIVAIPASGPASVQFSPAELDRFHRDGYALVRGLADPSLCRAMRDVTQAHLAGLVEPIEFEADVHYPGSPDGYDAPGGRTVRRLKQAQSRDPVFTEWLTQAGLLQRLRQLLGEDVYCPLAHHNCVMTKHPDFSSETGWHQDIRYWSFEKAELVTAWLALGREYTDNGCLRVIPGSYRETLEGSRFDEEIFFRTDLPENQELLDRAQPVELEAGDVLFFHCRTLHGAGRNLTGETKYSVVFTFHGADNRPVEGSRSAGMPELLLRGTASPGSSQRV
jgi:phytanoyl-CoA hydroxylase